MLTPLVDIMFLLLIFFMLSSQTSPYSLVPIAAAGATPGEPDPLPAEQPTAQQVIVAVGRDRVRVFGQRIAPSELAGTLVRLKAAGMSSALVITGDGASVQDLVDTLDAFEAAQFEQMQLVAGADR